jgi:FkbM family methyltransferase
MRKVIAALSRSALVRHSAKALRLDKVGNAWLRQRPLVKHLPGSGIIYRATRLESIPLGVEMFEQNILYSPSTIPPAITTFADLGCNVGYFTCWLAHHRGRGLKGLMLDANPEALAEAQWHVRANALSDVQAIHGVAGEAAGSVDFFLYDSNICSASQPPDRGVLDLAGKWRKISVPSVRIGTLWRDRFGNMPCDLLKVDIEGSELNFVREEQEFLSLVKTMIVEWHSWRTTKEMLTDELKRQGLRLDKVLEEGPVMGTALFSRAA